MRLVFRTRFRPPYNLFAASVFICWLTGSITLDILSEQKPDNLLLLFFAIVFCVFFFLMLRSLAYLVFFNRTGLEVSTEEIIYREPALFSVSTLRINRNTVTGTETSGGSILIRHREGDLILRSKNFLLDPWPAISAASMNDVRDPNPRNGTAGFEGVKCSSCGSSIRVDVFEEKELKCDYCGKKEPVTTAMEESVKMLREILITMPENMKQLGKEGEGMLTGAGKQSGKKIMTAAYITLGVWGLFALVEFISALFRDGTRPDFIFIMVALVLGVLSWISAFFLSSVLKRVIKGLTFRFGADPLPGGEASCRLCGGKLSEPGLVRRCPWCGSDNIVDSDSLSLQKQASRSWFHILETRIRNTVSDTGRIIGITSRQLIFLTASQFFWLHIPLLLYLDGSPGMLMKVTPLFIFLNFGAYFFLIRGNGELKRMDAFEPENKVK